jgi:hypothetical protein
MSGLRSLQRQARLSARHAVTLLAQGISPAILQRNWPIAYVLNAGSERDIDAYFPKSAQRWVRNRGLLFAGFLTGDTISSSIIVGCPYSNEELLAQRSATEFLVRQLSSLRVLRFALNGVIPAAIGKHGIPLPDERYVVSQEGTLFMVESNIASVLANPRHDSVKRLPVAVVGAGHCGAQLADRLARRGLKVLAFDRRPEAAQRLSGAVAFCGEDTSRIREAGVIVLLTTRGDDGMESILPHLGAGQVVISDTHPKVSSRLWERARQRGAWGYESATTLPGLRLIPKLPRWPADTLPGCVVTALVEALSGPAQGDPAAFARSAAALGIVGRLDTPPPYLTAAGQSVSFLSENHN